MVLRPLTRDELEKVFDDAAREVIDYFLEKTILLQPEIIEGQNELPIQIPKEHIEQWFVQAIHAKSVGAGSYPVDIMLGDIFGADVKMLSCKVDKDNRLKPRALSGETSLAQKFKSTGASLDDLFNNGKYEDILKGWQEILFNKIDGIKMGSPNLKIYYFFFLRAGKTFYLCGCEVNHQELGNTTVLEKSNKTNVHVGNFIDPEYGRVTIYKSKKRMELRLYPEYWYSQGNVIEFTTNSQVKPVDLREMALNKTLDEYKRKQFSEFLKG